MSEKMQQVEVGEIRFVYNGKDSGVPLYGCLTLKDGTWYNVLLFTAKSESKAVLTGFAKHPMHMEKEDPVLAWANASKTDSKYFDLLLFINFVDREDTYVAYLCHGVTHYKKESRKDVTVYQSTVYLAQDKTVNGEFKPAAKPTKTKAVEPAPNFDEIPF